MLKIERRPVAEHADGWLWPPDLHPVLRQVFARRALLTPEETDLSLRALRPIGEFEALEAGVKLLCRHRSDSIVVIGDFDADGATSTALMVLVLRTLGFREVHYFIPDRIELGYGLTPEVVERTRHFAPALLVTVDNGVTSVEGVDAARAAGMDVLVTDHHLPGERLPAANVLIDPNLPNDPFAGKHLAGVGVAFYLLAALGKALGNPKAVLEHSDLVALGTVADLVPLDHSNRILVEQGLRRIRAGRCQPGVAALLKVAGTEPGDVVATSLGYQVGPRLNAAGRLADMSLGVQCLTTADEGEARELAARLDGLNRERRELEARMKADAVDQLAAVEDLADDDVSQVVCLQQADWHQGLVGLVASRIKDRCNRPTFAFAPADKGYLKGSGRSIAGFHLRDALAEVHAREPGLMERFGGHAMAAGLSLATDGFATFARTINAVAREQLGSEAAVPRVLTDGALAPESINVTVARLLRDAGPWGQAFPEPCFDGLFEVVHRRVLKGAHLKMKLKPDGGQLSVDAIAFNCIDSGEEGSVPMDGTRLRLAYRLGINTWFKDPKLELFVEHFEPAP